MLASWRSMLMVFTLCAVWASQQDICAAQLTFHTDANTNSFTLKTPGLQQSFTRYYGAAKQPSATVEQQLRLQQQQQQLQNPTQFGGLASAGIQYTSAYPQQSIGGRTKAKPTNTIGGLRQLQQQQQQLQQQQQQLQQQQYLAQQQQQQQPLPNHGAAIPSYADQMQAAFVDYQRQRVEFEEQQQQLLQKLYSYYPDLSDQQQQQPQQPQPQQQQQAVLQQPGATSHRFSTRHQTGGLFGGNNGLQPQQQQQRPTVQQQSHYQSQLSQSPLQSTDAEQQQQQQQYYSTQQHVGFLQQQHQDILRDQQQSVAQQYATNQLAPSTTENYGMAVPESSVLGSPSYQPSADVSHVRFSSANLNYNF